jgi:hypothetical protein
METARQSQPRQDDPPNGSSTTSVPDSTSKLSAKSDPGAPAAEGPAKTRSSRREGVVTSSGKHKTLVDPMASWNETPPWPEGPRLMADVETSATKYVNLRPNEMGVMPSLNVKPEEVLDISLSVPESSPGEPIYLELPNGGGFPGETSRGKSLPVSDKRTVSFSVSAASLRGHCTVHIRQGGHTRTLPLWVGDRPEPAPADPVDPNSPAI